MIRTALASFATLVLLVALPHPAEAQQPRTFGAGWTAGGSYVTDLNPDAANAEALAPGLGFVLGIHVDRWIGPNHRTGVRVQGSYQQPRLDYVGEARRFDAASADLSLLLRLTSPEEGSATPYLAGGVGAVWYDLGRGDPLNDPAADAQHDGRAGTFPTAILGLGLDIPLDWDWYRLPVQLRLEAADHISFRSPLRRVTDGDRHGAVHHFRFTLGMYSTLRRR